MELYIHYTSLPQDKELPDVVEELNEVLEEGGVVCGGEDGRIDLELEAICPLLIRLFHGCHRQVIFRHFPDDMKNPGFNTDSHPPIYLHIRSGVITAITGCRCRWRCCRWRCYRWRRRRWCCYGWCLYG